MPKALVVALVRGAALFDRGAFFEAHEVWEDAWRATTDPTDRRFLQGLIQVAACFHKLTVMSSPASAVRLAQRALAKLDLCPSLLHGVDVARWREGVRTAAWAIADGRLPEEGIPQLGVLINAPG